MKAKKFVMGLIFGTIPLLVITAVNAAGSAESGSTKSMFCAACHGLDGNNAYASARLAGQSTTRFLESMMAYKNGKRLHPVMNIFSMGLSKQDVEDLAMYYASQKPFDLKHASLYWRLGGPEVINSAVDELVKVAKDDPRLGDRFLGEQAPKLKELLCQVAGGPCTYAGRDMKTVHSDMNISEAEFAAVGDNLAKVLDAIEVAEQERDELVGLIAPMKGDIVGQ